MQKPLEPDEMSHPGPIALPECAQLSDQNDLTHSEGTWRYREERPSVAPLFTEQDE